MIQRKTFKLIWLISLLACYLIPSAQVPNSVNVNNLSDQQVQQIVDEISNRGLTMEQAIELARVRGASPTQISQLQSRIRELKVSGGSSATPNTQPSVPSNTPIILSQKAAIDPTPKNKNFKAFSFPRWT